MKFAILSMLDGAFDPYWRDIEAGVRNAAKNFDSEIEYMAPNDVLTEKEISLWQLRAVEQLLKTDGIEAVAVAMMNYEKAVSAIKKLVDAGIPVITFDTDAPDSGRSFFVGTNNELAGKTCAYQIAKFMNFSGGLIIDTPSLDVYSCVERLSSFKEVINRYEKIHIVKTVCGEENSEKMKEAAQVTATEYPELKGIFCTTGTTARFNAEAIEKAGKAGEVSIVSFDADPYVMRYVEKGIIDLTIAQRPYTIGFRVAGYLNEIAKRGIETVRKSIPENGIIDTGIQTITAGNIKNYVESLRRQGLSVDF
ncbi:MAG TPA: substrate-binding domain-containing protein [bacterium]|nr:substrate-binding domain-containing protein [bacterium]